MDGVVDDKGDRGGERNGGMGSRQGKGRLRGCANREGEVDKGPRAERAQASHPCDHSVIKGHTAQNVLVGIFKEEEGNGSTSPGGRSMLKDTLVVERGVG